MKPVGAFVGGVALGAGLMLLLDPTSGRRRRHLLRDKAVRGGREISEAADTTVTRIRNKARGLVAETRSRFAGEDVDDSVLESRIRASMGHAISNAGAIAIHASDGMVTVSGPVLATEADGLLSRISSVPGVHEVRSQLTIRNTRNGISGLQGARDSGSQA